MSATLPDDIFETKMQALIAAGLTSKTLAQAVLNGLSLSELAGFLIDLELSPTVCDTIWESLSVPAATKAAAAKAFHEQLSTAMPDELAAAMERHGVKDSTLRNALIQLAGKQSVQTIYDAILANNRNAYEVFSAVDGKQNKEMRLIALAAAAKKAKTAADLWQVTCATLPVADQLVLLFLLEAPPEALQRLARHWGKPADFLLAHSPAVAAAGIKPTPIPASEIKSLLAHVKSDDLFELLSERETARSVWFQTVGPNVQHTFSGILDRSIPAVMHAPTPHTIELPDFQLTLYEGGVVKANHHGIDGYFSTPTDVHTIAHAYQGSVNHHEIHLVEDSVFEINEKRPSLGDLHLTKFKIEPSGFGATCEWQGKAIALKWDPGF